jgi:hypothetical protein
MEQSSNTPAKESAPEVETSGHGSGSAEPPELVDELGPIPTFPPRAVDPKTGRVLPISEEERAARSAAFRRMLKVLHTITDESDTEENWNEVFRNIDAGRPHRPLFKGLY